MIAKSSHGAVISTMAGFERHLRAFALTSATLSGAILAETGKKLGVDREKANIIREIA
jgi:hypothetical protein